MLSKQILRIVLVGIGLGSIAGLVILAGPFIEIGGTRPLENRIVRAIVLLLLASAVASMVGKDVLKRRRGAATVASGLSAPEEDSDASVFKERMKDALATLKTASGGRATYLYDLPWYVLIGPPGAGKTTALIHSGLKFPLARGTRPAAIAGVGGTRYCDWWFTEDAVLIDTAGRYTTQDSDVRTDQKSWLAFLDTLKRGRPRQPINGVLVAISVEDLLTLGSTEIAAHAAAIRARLLELHSHLKVDFPVYALFTKTDLLLGFSEYFQHLGEQGRQQVFGATFQTDDKTKNLVNSVPEEFDSLVERLNEDMPDRLQEEPDSVARVQAYGFPTQLEALKRPLFDILNQIFEPTRYHANATLRGFYFTSGTQLGTPIDQLIGALEKSFGAVEVAASAYSGGGKSFFLTDLIRKVIIGEAAWVSTDRAAVRRAAIVKACAFASLILVAAGLAGLWWISYGHNARLIADTQADAASFNQQGGALAKQTTIGDRDLAQIIRPLDTLRYLPAGYAALNENVSFIHGLGLSQHDRLRSAAVQSYHDGLERMLRPRLIYRLEEVLDAKKADPSAVYAALKVYMMLGLQAPTVDKVLVVDWMKRDWADNLYPGQGNEAGRQNLQSHLEAMLTLDDGKPLITLSRTLLETAQGSLAQLSVARRAYELLKSAAASAGQSDWLLARQGALQAAAVFEPTGAEPLATIRVPYFFTYGGFHRAVLSQLEGVAAQVNKESWVLGESGAQSAVQEQYKTLRRDLLDIYAKDFIATWQGMLAKIRLKRLAGDKTYVALTAVASPTSPLKQLIESVRDETALDRERPDPAGKPANAELASAAATPASDPAAFLQDGPPGAAADEAFRPFQDVLAGDSGSRPIDLVLKVLGSIASDLKRASTSPSDAAQSNADLQQQIASLRTLAAGLPVPFAAMMQKAAADFDNEGVGTAVALLAQSLGEVSSSCKALVENSYPFARSAEREIGLVDFAKLFGPGGDLDGFFSRNLAKYADKSKRDWTWKASDPVGRALSPNSIRSFQQASQIRDAFFSAGTAQPAFTVTVTPPAVVDPNVSAKLDFYGTAIVSQASGQGPVNAPWPGPGSFQLRITVTTTTPPSPDLPAPKPAGPATPGDVSILVDKSGVWALFHLLDDAGRGTNKVAFFSGGQNYQYQFASASAANPLNLTAVRQFRCPAGI